MRSLLAGGALVLAASAPAFAQSQTQKNVMQHAAVLFVAEKWCSDYKVNTSTISRAASEAKVNPGKEPFKTYLKDKMEETETALSEAGATAGCKVIYDLYGPKGSAASGQMIRK